LNVREHLHRVTSDLATAREDVEMLKREQFKADGLLKRMQEFLIACSHACSL